jgi:hypothetical protein
MYCSSLFFMDGLSYSLSNSAVWIWRSQSVGHRNREADHASRLVLVLAYTAGAPQRPQIVKLQVHRTFVRCARPNVSGWVYGKWFSER